METANHPIPIFFTLMSIMSWTTSMPWLTCFFNRETFNFLGITVNATYNGGDIEQQYDEAKKGDGTNKIVR